MSRRACRRRLKLQLLRKGGHKHPRHANLHPHTCPGVAIFFTFGSPCRSPLSAARGPTTHWRPSVSRRECPRGNRGVPHASLRRGVRIGRVAEPRAFLHQPLQAAGPLTLKFVDIIRRASGPPPAAPQAWARGLAYVATVVWRAAAAAPTQEPCQPAIPQNESANMIVFCHFNRRLVRTYSYAPHQCFAPQSITEPNRSKYTARSPAASPFEYPADSPVTCARITRPCASSKNPN